MNPARATSCFLKFVAIVQMLTLGIVFVPAAWIGTWHVRLGLGHMPDATFLRYVIRGASYCQAGIGILVWVVATDVIRYRPLVLAIGAIYFVGGPVFYFIDSIAGLPFWWCLMDSVSCFFAGSVILTLYKLTSQNAPQSTRTVA